MDALRIPPLALLSAFLSTPAFGQTTLNVTSGSMSVSAPGGGAWSLGATNLTPQGRSLGIAPSALPVSLLGCL
jgi:hypothetical protein